MRLYLKDGSIPTVEASTGRKAANGKAVSVFKYYLDISKSTDLPLTGALTVHLFVCAIPVTA